MPLTNTQIKHYDSNVLRLPKDKRETYNAQVDRLIAALKDSLKKQDKIIIKKVVKAGSFAKHTILRPIDSSDCSMSATKPSTPTSLFCCNSAGRWKSLNRTSYWPNKTRRGLGLSGARSSALRCKLGMMLIGPIGNTTVYSHSWYRSLRNV